MPRFALIYVHSEPNNPQLSTGNSGYRCQGRPCLQCTCQSLPFVDNFWIVEFVVSILLTLYTVQVRIDITLLDGGPTFHSFTQQDAWLVE